MWLKSVLKEKALCFYVILIATVGTCHLYKTECINVNSKAKALVQKSLVTNHSSKIANCTWFVTVVDRERSTWHWDHRNLARKVAIRRR